MIRYCMIGLLFCLLPLQTDAQYSHGPVVGLGYSINGFHADGLNNFVTTYNDYYQVGMQQALNEYGFTTMNGFNFSLGWRFMKRHKSGFSGDVLYTYGYNSNTKHTVLWNNTGNDFNVEFYSHDILFEAGYQIKGLFFIHGTFGFMFRHTNMEVWQIYQDGSRSMGSEYVFPGFYQADPISIELGGSFGFRAWHFFFPIRITYGLPFIGSDLTLYDYNSNSLFPADFPRDFQVWLNSYGVINESNTIKEDDFMGLRLSFGVEFMIPAFKKH